MAMRTFRKAIGLVLSLALSSLSLVVLNASKGLLWASKKVLLLGES